MCCRGLEVCFFPAPQPVSPDQLCEGPWVLLSTLSFLINVTQEIGKLAKRHSGRSGLTYGFHPGKGARLSVMQTQL